MLPRWDLNDTIQQVCEFTWIYIGLANELPRFTISRFSMLKRHVEFVIRNKRVEL